MSADTTPEPRYHGFDALRACAALYGIAASAALMYSPPPAIPNAQASDAHHSVAANWLVDASGLVLLPVFFLLAGFFAGRTASKYGERRFLWNRAQRLAVPFAIGWAVGFPVLLAAAASAGAEAPSLRPYPMHLWFLEYLLAYCAAGAGLAPLLKPLRSGFRWLIKSGLLPLAGAALTTPVLVISPAAVVESPASFVPDPVGLIAYGMFFAAGWGLHENADRLVWLGRWGHSALLAGTLLVGLIPAGGHPTDPRAPITPVCSGLVTARTQAAASQGLPAHLSGSAARAAVAWLLALGLMGVFFRHMNVESRALSYVSRASYWLYLAHLPVLAWIGLALWSLDWPGDVKLALAALACVCLLLAVYELWARVVRGLGARASVPPPVSAALQGAPAGPGSQEVLV